jgi:hypothetical protein
MTKTAQRFTVILATGFTAALFALPASAVPVFARKYQTSCQTCHVGFPKLNAFGEAFRLNGYRMPKETEDQIKQKPVSLGADAYKRLWPNAIYPSDLPGNVPIALNVKMASVYASSIDDSGRQITHNDFQFPQEVNMFTAGTLGEHMSFLGEVTYAENPDGSASTEIERVHLGLNSIIGPEHLVNVKIGKFATDLADGFHEMWIATDEPIDTMFAYNPIGLNGGTGIGEGGISLPDNVKGIEVYGVAKHRWFYTAGVVNGLGPSSSGNTDVNAHKDLYARLDYKFGGMGLDGDTTGVTLPPENWREKSFRVGVFGYNGDGRGFDVPVTDDAGNQFNVQDRTFSRAGIYASWWMNDLNVFGSVVRGRDKLQAFTPDGAFVSQVRPSYNTWFVQGDYVILPPLQASLRYENLKPGDPQAPNTRAIEAALSFFAYANVKTMVEYRRDLHESKNYQIATILRFAF